MDLSSALTMLAPPAEGIDLQAAIDAALDCPADADPSECTRLDLIVSVRTDTGCALLEIEDGSGTSLTGPFLGTVNASSDLRAQVATFSLKIPYQTASGPVDIDLDVSGVVMTASIEADRLSNIVFGGAGVELDRNFRPCAHASSLVT